MSFVGDHRASESESTIYAGCICEAEIAVNMNLCPEAH